MRHLAAIALLVFAAVSLPPGAAEAQNACELYRVKKGDTLRKIAESAYGTDSYRTVYRANRAEIGRNPNVIRIGIVLRLPCLDGSLPDPAAAGPGPGSGEVLSLVTANGYLPYTDESLAHRGLFTHLVTQAMARAAPRTRVDIVFVNDWAAHLEELLPRRAFDASFPWTRPGCETQDALTPVELYACQNYLYSDPFYEIVEGYFALPGSDAARTTAFAGLSGATICRPEGYPTGHLEESGLMPPEVTLVQPASSYDCFDLLMSGRADVVALDTRAGERVLDDMGLGLDVAENPHLFSIQPLQVAVHRNNPKGEKLIEDLNRGLRVMFDSGEWTSIVANGLKDQRPDLTN